MKQQKQILDDVKVKKVKTEHDNTMEDEQSVQNVVATMKLKRGYKKCKNLGCDNLLHIHTKVCPKCEFSIQFQEVLQKTAKKKTEDVLDFARKLSEISKNNKQIPKKYLDSIFVFKKNLLQKNQSNFDDNLLQPMLYDISKRIYVDQSKTKCQIKEFRDEKKYKQQFQEFGKQILINFQNDDGSFQQEKCEQTGSVLQPRDRELWEQCLFNFGCPIVSIAFAPRSTKKDPLRSRFESHDLSQYLAVSLQINVYDYTKKQESQIARQQIETLNQFELSQLHLMGVPYEGKGLIAIVKVPYEGNFVQPKILYYIASQQGCVIKHKWCPKFSNSEQEIGLLGCITAQGILQIISIPKLEKNNHQQPMLFIESQPVQTIQFKGVMINCFDWVVSNENDIMAIGDNIGGVYVIKLGQDLSPEGYILLNFIPFLHRAEITDLKFYIHNDKNCPLLATASYDGNVKVLDPLSSSDALFDMNLSSKGVIQIEWDMGAKYLMVIRDDCSNRALLISFFAVEKGQKGKEVGYELSSKIEQRFLGNLTGNDITLSSSQSFHNDQIFFSNCQGSVFTCLTEQVRKLAVKKEKKQTQHGILFSQVLISEDLTVTVLNPKIQKQVKQEMESHPRRRKLEIESSKVSFREISLCPNDIKSIEIEQNQMNLTGLFAQANLSGLLFIHKILNEKPDTNPMIV